MEIFYKILLLIVLPVALIIAPIALYRIFRAKTRTAYVNNILLFTGTMLLVFLCTKAAGLMPEIQTQTSIQPSTLGIFGNMPTSKILMLALAAVVWIGGGNLLFLLHNRRLGKKWWQTLNPLNPPFKDFNSREWLILVALIIVSLGLAVLANSSARGV